MSLQADITQNQDRSSRNSASEAKASMDLAAWEATLIARLDLADPKDHARVLADAIREAVRLCRAGVLEREAAIDVLVSAARIFALTTPEIENGLHAKAPRQLACRPRRSFRAMLSRVLRDAALPCP
jgi:NAD(P)-dependent dehydrogenase (short-subunit alcohol dehydrogenase family)